jgi:hypothetical protein
MMDSGDLKAAGSRRPATLPAVSQEVKPLEILAPRGGDLREAGIARLAAGA